MEHESVALAFRSGLTMSQVGEKFGVTRERIRQVLKRAGVTWRDGGAHVRSAQRSEKLIRLMDETGCGPGEAGSLCGLPVTPEATEWARDFRDQRAITRFWNLVDSSGGPDACHPWTGPVLPTGYGVSRGAIQRITGAQYAHRAAFILSNGRQPNAPVLFKGTACVLHSCDNPPCCNPRHLREGTMADNMKDRDVRGRSGGGKRRGGKRSKSVRMKMAKIRAAWWKSLTPEQHAAHVQKVVAAVRAKIAQDPTGHAAKIQSGRGRR
jgi:hypothetical protein